MVHIKFFFASWLLDEPKRWVRGLKTCNMGSGSALVAGPQAGGAGITATLWLPLRVLREDLIRLCRGRGDRMSVVERLSLVCHYLPTWLPSYSTSVPTCVYPPRPRLRRLTVARHALPESQRPQRPRLQLGGQVPKDSMTRTVRGVME